MSFFEAFPNIATCQSLVGTDFVHCLHVMKQTIYMIVALILCGTAALRAQTPETMDIYGERQDSLKAAVFTGHQSGNYLPRGKEIRTEVIS